MYKFKLKDQKIGYKRKTYTDDNLNELPEELLKRLKNVKEVKNKKAVVKETKEQGKNNSAL